MDSSGAEKTLPLAFPLPLCPGGVKAGGLPNTCRLDESLKVAVSLRTYDSWQTNVAGPKEPQAYVVVAKTNISIPDCMMVRSCDLKRKWASSS